MIANQADKPKHLEIIEFLGKLQKRMAPLSYYYTVTFILGISPKFQEWLAVVCKLRVLVFWGAFGLVIYGAINQLLLASVKTQQI